MKITRRRFVQVVSAVSAGGLLRGSRADSPTSTLRVGNSLYGMKVIPGYRGPVVVHVSGNFSNAPGYDPLRVAEQCHAAMARALQQARVT